MWRMRLLVHVVRIEPSGGRLAIRIYGILMTCAFRNNSDC